MPMGETTPRPVTTIRFFTGVPNPASSPPTYYAKPPEPSNRAWTRPADAREVHVAMSVLPDRRRYNRTMSSPVAAPPDALSENAETPTNSLERLADALAPLLLPRKSARP
jgi:hypothetical protein